MKYQLDFYTEYHQIYISDKASPKQTDKDSFWTYEAFLSRLAMGDGILGVSLGCYGPFKGELILLDSKNDWIELNQYDHVVEGGLNIQSGILHVLDCASLLVKLEMKVKPGKYRARIYSLNLDSVVGDSGNDYYKIELWPDTNMERVVLKQYNSKQDLQ